MRFLSALWNITATCYELMAKARLKAVCKKIPVEGLRAELNELLDGEEPVGEEQ